MNKNTGTNIMVAILIIVCIIQACAISSLEDTIEDFESRMDNVERRVRENENYIYDLLNENEKQDLADYEFGIKNVDLITGQVEFEFTITPYNFTENTQIKVSNSIKEVTLTKSGNSFVGSLSYPMNDETYETKYYIYEGNMEKGSRLIDWLGSGLWADKCTYADFEGTTIMGNNKLTLAGNINYYINVDDEIVSSKLVFLDNEIQLGDKFQGNVKINFSESIKGLVKEEYFKELYIEFIMESGYVYRVYPYITADLTHNLQGDTEFSEYIYQNDTLEIIKGGTVLYNISGY